MEEINLSSNRGRSAISDRAQSDRGQEQPAVSDSERSHPSEVRRGMVGFSIVASCCVALWAFASRLLAAVFACSVVVALVALWITVSVAYVIYGVLATVRADRECSQAEE